MRQFILATLLIVVSISACIGNDTSVTEEDVSSTMDASILEKGIVDNLSSLDAANESDDNQTESNDSSKNSTVLKNITLPDLQVKDSETDEEQEAEEKHQGDSNVQLIPSEGPRNTTIKYTASGFDPSETVEIRISGLYYTAATFFSHDGTIPPSDLYIPFHNSTGEPIDGTLEITAAGTKSGKAFRTYYAIKD